MEELFKKPEKANGTRWVDHKLRAISKLLSNWKIIVMHLMNYAEDKSNGSEYRAKARGILNKIMEFKFVWYLHFTKDVLNEIVKASLLFQREDICTASAVTKLQNVETNIRNMIENKGQNTLEFEQNLAGNTYREHTLKNVRNVQQFENEKRRILNELLDCFQARFKELTTDPLYLVTNVFDPKNWPDIQQPAALLQYGADDIKLLFNHFEIILTNAGCDLDKALEEWNDLKMHISRNVHYRPVHPLAIWQRISQEDEGKGDFQNILKIIHLVNIYPLSNASCEHAFSVMKRVKSDWRCNLSAESLDDLMRISIMGPKLKDFKPQQPVRRWWITGQKTKRPTFRR